MGIPMNRLDDWRNLPRALRWVIYCKEEENYPKPRNGFDYWDRLSEIKNNEDTTEWFRVSH
jgi:hypothetical protein